MTEEIGLWGSQEKPQLTPQAEAGIVPDPGQGVGQVHLDINQSLDSGCLKKRMWLWAHCSL